MNVMVQVDYLSFQFSTLLNFEHTYFFNFSNCSFLLLLYCVVPACHLPNRFRKKCHFVKIIPHHQLQHEDSLSDVLQPEEGIDENIDESPIRHASHNRTNGDASNPCFHFTERTWDSCRQKYVYKAHCHGAHVACYRAMDRGYSYPACQVVFGFPQSKYNSKCAKLPIDCQCAA